MSMIENFRVEQPQDFGVFRAEPYEYKDPGIAALVKKYNADMTDLYRRDAIVRTGQRMGQTANEIGTAFREMGRRLNESLTPRRNERGQFTKAR